MMQVNLKDVFECRRVMKYNEAFIEYTTGIDSVYVNANDILFVVQNCHNEFGYVRSMEDLVYLLDKNGCLNGSLLCYDHSTIADYLYENHINIDMVIKLAEKCKVIKFKQYLIEAKNIINKYGLYVPEPQMKHYDKRKNNEKNLAETFDISVLTDAAYRMGMYEDNLYLDLVNIVTMVVFNNDIENMRYNLNMLYEDYLSDYISDFEYDMVAYCCKILSYLLAYSDIGLYGLEVFIRMAINVALRDYDKKYCVERKNDNLIESIFDKANTNELEYDESVVMYKKEKISNDELDDFKRYM